MAISTTEAALILGQSEYQIRKMQREGTLPKPIPDDYFDAVIKFRLQLEEVMRRKVDARRGNVGMESTGTDTGLSEMAGEAE